MYLRIFINQLAAHDGDVPGRSVMVRGFRKSAAIHEMGVGHAKAGCPFIHHPHKLILAACYVLRHGHRRVIAGCNDNAFNQGFHGLFLAFLQEHLGTSHGFGVGAGNYLVRQLDLSGLKGIKNQYQRHNLGNTGRASLFICILFIDYLSGRCFHENGRWSGYLDSCLTLVRRRCLGISRRLNISCGPRVPRRLYILPCPSIFLSIEAAP